MRLRATAVTRGTGRSRARAPAQTGETTRTTKKEKRKRTTKKQQKKNKKKKKQAQRYGPATPTRAAALPVIRWASTDLEPPQLPEQVVPPP